MKPDPYPADRATHVFYLSSHGMAGDHWFDWVPKALSAHPEILIYFGESVRSKYLKERTRKERPEILAYTKLLTDLGAAYKAIGNCFCYRAYQLEKLRFEYGDRVRWANLVRHPYCWLHFYTAWRTSNMNMPPNNTMGVDHEWSVTCHDELKSLGLKPYTRADVEVWASYQGMLILNRMISDTRPGVRNITLESLIADRTTFSNLVADLTHGRVSYEPPLLDLVYSWTNTPFRPAGRVLASAQAEYKTWPDWKREAFAKIVKPQTLEMFRNYGYEV